MSGNMNISMARALIKDVQIIIIFLSFVKEIAFYKILK